jgi:hypothetical protein
VLNFLRRVDWLPLVAAALFYVLAIDLMSSSGFPQHDHQNNQAENGPEHSGLDIFPDSPEGWTALFTCTLTISTIGLWLATNKIVRSAEENSRTIERAYVMGGGVAVVPTAFVAHPVPHVVPRPPGNEFQIRVANHGKTAARLTGVWWNFREIGSIWNAEPDYAHSHPFDDMVMPGTADRPLFVVGIPPELQKPVVIIRYTYLDVWDEPHESRFINEVFRHQAIPDQIVAPESYTRLT